VRGGLETLDRVLKFGLLFCHGELMRLNEFGGALTGQPRGSGAFSFSYSCYDVAEIPVSMDGRLKVGHDVGVGYEGQVQSGG
jgi:hypothetical protein